MHGLASFGGRMALGTLVAALLVGCNMLPGAVTDVKVGDCFDLPADDGDISEVQHRPCNEPHDAEVVAVLTHPAAAGDPYPVLSGFGDYATEHCVPAFEDHVGRTLDEATEYDVGYFHPTLLGWRDGDRGFSCHVVRVDGAKMTASVRAGQ
ncbi:hypothetical protein BH23CHL7_BH23CHL7_04530 [soil metagenome]